MVKVGRWVFASRERERDETWHGCHMQVQCHSDHKACPVAKTLTSPVVLRRGAVVYRWHSAQLAAALAAALQLALGAACAALVLLVGLLLSRGGAGSADRRRLGLRERCQV